MISAAVDGDFNNGNGWAVDGRTPGSGLVAVFQSTTDLGAAAGTRLRVQFHHLFIYEHSLGKFRLSATTSDRSTYAQGGACNNADATGSAVWTVLTPGYINSAGGETLTVQQDGTILAKRNAALDRSRDLRSVDADVRDHRLPAEDLRPRQPAGQRPRPLPHQRQLRAHRAYGRRRGLQCHPDAGCPGADADGAAPRPAGGFPRAAAPEFREAAPRARRPSQGTPTKPSRDRSRPATTPRLSAPAPSSFPEPLPVNPWRT